MMYSIHFLPAGFNFCSQTENLGACRGDTANYSMGRFKIPTNLNNPNRTNPTTGLRFTVVYFKFGYNHNLNSTRSPTYDVKFDINKKKWSCTCPHYTLTQRTRNLCCKHIQGVIDLQNNFNRFDDLRYLDLLRSHIHQQ